MLIRGHPGVQLERKRKWWRRGDTQFWPVWISALILIWFPRQMCESTPTISTSFFFFSFSFLPDSDTSKVKILQWFIFFNFSRNFFKDYMYSFWLSREAVEKWGADVGCWLLVSSIFSSWQPSLTFAWAIFTYQTGRKKKAMQSRPPHLDIK